MSEEINLEQLNFLHPTVRPYIKVLLTYEFGLLKDLPKIHSIQCGSIVKKNQSQFGDRFHLRLLYCKKPLNWQVLLNGNDITKAPDFILEENFLAGETEETIKKKVPSLAHWQPSNVQCLLNVILELLDLYKSYQINLIRVNPRLQRYLFEYDTFMAMSESDGNDVEVCVQNTSRSVVLFLIHLNVDFSKLPTALPNCKNVIVLVIEFKDNGKNTIQLMPRMELGDVLGGPLDLPELPPNMSLIDYVPKVENVLQERIEQIIHFTHERKLLYSYLLQYFEPALISGDDVNFRSISFLFELNSTYFILNIQIPQNYPEHEPAFQLLPFQVHKNASTKMFDFNNYSYDRNMSHEEVAKSIFSFVKEAIVADFEKKQELQLSS